MHLFTEADFETSVINSGFESDFRIIISGDTRGAFHINGMEWDRLKSDYRVTVGVRIARIAEMRSINSMAPN